MGVDETIEKFVFDKKKNGVRLAIFAIFAILAAYSFLDTIVCIREFRIGFDCLFRGVVRYQVP